MNIIFTSKNEGERSEHPRDAFGQGIKQPNETNADKFR
jgi:hypothetical protein